MSGGPSRPWTDGEIAFLRECANARMSVESFAPLLDRSVAAIRMMRHKLGLLPPDGRMRHMMPPRSPVTVAQIKKVVAQHFDVPANEMESSSRKRGVSRPRQVAMFFARDVAHKSYPMIGQLFGGRDHTTVIHACRSVERLAEENAAFADNVRGLRDEITNPRNSHVDNDKVSFPPESVSA